MAKQNNFGNPHLEKYKHNLKSAKYEYRGSEIDFRKAGPKLLERLAKDPACKLIELDVQSQAKESEENPEPKSSGKGKDKKIVKGGEAPNGEP